MKAIVQRVQESRVEVNGTITGKIGNGLLVLLGVGKQDTEEDVRWLFDKICNLRIFANDSGKFDYSLLDINGHILIVSQFTLFGDCRKGRRPNFEKAAPPELARSLYIYSIEYCRSKGIETGEGEFGAMMDVHLINDGPVTLIIDSKD